jgi:hypothetical protein
MALLDLFRWLDNNLPGTFYLREATYAFSILLTVHVIGMCLFMGLIVMMDLRLAGLGFRGTPLSQLQRRLFPWQMMGFATVVVTGLMLFYSKPLYYYGKGFFWLKLVLMALAGVNATVFHLTTYRSVARWDTNPVLPFGAKLAGVVGLVLWGGVLVTGRLVAYEWWTTEYF